MTTFAADLYLLVAAYGLALAVSYAGLPVLGQGAFMAVGAFGTVLLADAGLPLGIAVVFAAVIAAVAGYLVGFAAARLEGAPLALATWALAALAYAVLRAFPAVSGGSQGRIRPTPAQLVSTTLGVVVTLRPWVHVLVGAGLVLLTAAAVWRAGRGPWGLDCAALRTGPALADSLGVPVQRRRRAVLATAAALGGLGGAGTAVLLGVVAYPDYSPLLSLQLFVAVLVGGTANWWGPPVGVGLLAALPSAADAIATGAGVDPLRVRAVLTAALLVAALTLRRPVATLLARLGVMRGGRAAPADPGTPPRADGVAGTATDAGAGSDEGRPLLALRGVEAGYGAVQALAGIDLDVRAGEVHALIGPNGSGKSTALRVAAGVLAPTAGSVDVAGSPAAPARSAADRVRAGVTRTLQRTVGLGDLPPLTQAAVGARARERTPYLALRHLLATPVARHADHERAAVAAAALASVGLRDRACTPPDRLDSAEQRLLQVARAVATGARALLLDEPAAGMSGDQRDRLVAVLRDLAGAGHGVLLVEHDMGIVGRAADRVTVLAEGRVLATGTPGDVRADSRVRAAYLGEEAPAR